MGLTTMIRLGIAATATTYGLLMAPQLTSTNDFPEITRTYLNPFAWAAAADRVYAMRRETADLDDDGHLAPLELQAYFCERTPQDLATLPPPSARLTWALEYRLQNNHPIPQSGARWLHHVHGRGQRPMAAPPDVVKDAWDLNGDGEVTLEEATNIAFDEGTYQALRSPWLTRGINQPATSLDELKLPARDAQCR